jgi:hypothetical protein
MMPLLGALARGHMTPLNGDGPGVKLRKTRQVEMTPAQCRAARGLLDWIQAKPAEAARLAVSTVVRFERSGRAAPVGAIQVMQLAFEAAGVEFTNGDEPGVKLGAKKG